MAVRLSLADLISAGWRAVGRYTGTLFAVFLVQSIVALACMVGVSIALAQAFSQLPLWDEAVDGDLVALIWCLRHGQSAIIASLGLVFGALVLWQVVTWFVAGGLYGVLANRPEGRGDTARCFGAAGASTYLAYARLALCSIPGWIVVLFLLGTGLDMAQKYMSTALTIPQLLGPLALATLPALLLMHVLWTITDYARVELALRHESHDPGAVMAYVRTVTYVLKRPLTLVHGALGWIAFVLVTVGYAYLAEGHPMYGAEGAVTLFVIRQGVSLLRFAIRFGVLAGQVELGKTRALPPRRVEVKAEPANDRD